MRGSRGPAGCDLDLDRDPDPDRDRDPEAAWRSTPRSGALGSIQLTTIESGALQSLAPPLMTER